MKAIYLVVGICSLIVLLYGVGAGLGWWMAVIWPLAAALLAYEAYDLSRPTRRAPGTSRQP